MPSLEERLAYIEGKVTEHSQGFGDLRGLIVHLDGRIDTLALRVESLDQKVDRFRGELAERIDGLSVRIDALDRKLDHRIDTLDQKVSQHFVWTMGAHVTILAAIVAALIAT